LFVVSGHIVPVCQRCTYVSSTYGLHVCNFFEDPQVDMEAVLNLSADMVAATILYAP